MEFMDVLSCVLFVVESAGNPQWDRGYALWGFIWQARLSRPPLPQRVEGSLGILLNVLDIMRSLQATDIRDNIFSLQGISDEGLEPVLALTEVMGNETQFLKIARKGFAKFNSMINSLVPELDFGRPIALKANYRRNAVDIYTDVTRFLIRKSPRTLDVLNHVTHNSDPEGGDYPSWVPKWFEARSVHLMGGIHLAGFCDGHFRYFAQVHDNPLRGNPQRPRVLTVDGFMVDSVTTCTEILKFESSDDMYSITKMERAWCQLFECALTPRQDGRYRDGQLLDTAFCKAISAHPLGIIFHAVIADSVTGLDIGVPQDFIAKREAIIRDSERMLNILMNDLSSKHQNGGHVASLSQEAKYFLMGLRLYAHNRRVFLTRERRLGLGPQIMQTGDQVVVLFGNRFPFILRPRPDHHVFIGQCSLVDDEAMSRKITARLLRPSTAAPGFTPPRMTFELR